MPFVAAFSLLLQPFLSSVRKRAGVASDERRQKVCAVTPGETLGTLYNIVGYNKTQKQKPLRVPVGHVPLVFPAAGPFHGQPVGSYNESARAEKWEGGRSV
jgi:hypothetical protein